MSVEALLVPLKGVEASAGVLLKVIAVEAQQEVSAGVQWRVGGVGVGVQLNLGLKELLAIVLHPYPDEVLAQALLEK